MSTVIGSTMASSYAAPIASGIAPGSSAAKSGGASPTPSSTTAATSATGTSTSADKTSPPPSSTVTLSPQALSAMNREAGSTPGATAPPAAEGAGSTDPSIYDEMKNGLSTAADDIGNAVDDGAHWLASGVEAAFSAADTLAHGIADLPFVAVAKVCDAAGAVLDAI